MKKMSGAKKFMILWSKLLAVLIQAGGFVSYINQNITGENFPLQDEDLEFKPVEIVSIKKRLAELGRQWLPTSEVLVSRRPAAYGPLDICPEMLCHFGAFFI